MTKHDYSVFLYTLALQLHFWKQTHPNANLSFKWNWPDDTTTVIATVRDAIKMEFLEVNDEANAMLEELGWLAQCPNAPTVLQVRHVIDSVYGVADSSN